MAMVYAPGWRFLNENRPSSLMAEATKGLVMAKRETEARASGVNRPESSYDCWQQAAQAKMASSRGRVIADSIVLRGGRNEPVRTVTVRKFASFEEADRADKA
jgi:hypothetical protein